MNFLATLLLSTALSNTWVVDPNGGGDFTTIQAAIDASSAGDLIQITPATYTEDLLVHVSVTLEALPGGTVLVQPATSNKGSGVGSQIDTSNQACIVEAHDVTIRSLTFDGDNPGIGSGIDVRNGIITNYLTGPWDRLTVEDCEVRNIHLRAVYGSTGTGHLFRNNLVTNAQGMYLESSGIMLWGANGEVHDNEVRDCSIGITNHAGSSGDIWSNQVFDCDLGVLTNGTNAATDVYDNTFTNCDQGHQLIGTRADVTVRDNTYLGSQWSVTYYGSSGNGYIEDNVMDGQGVAYSVGVWASTDLAPWGTNSILGHVKRNEIRNVRNGVALVETTASAGELVDLTLGGASGDGNTFRNVENLNVRLGDCNDDVDATWNSWGVATAAAIEESIRHQVDDPALGLVDFSNALADQVCVDAAGGGDFLTIQEGIDFVDAGGTVKVAVGDYPESLVIGKSLTLAGSGADADPLEGTRIFGDNAAPGIGNDVISVLTGGVEVRDVWIDAWSSAHADRYGAAIAFLSAPNGVVRDVQLRRGIYGVYAFQSDGLLVEDCRAVDCGVSTSIGGCYVVWDSVAQLGSAGAGNSAVNSNGIGFLSTNGSTLTAVDNLASGCELGFVVRGAGGASLLDGNGTVGCEQGIQAIANDADVDLVDNTVVTPAGASAGIALYGDGTGSYTLTGNSVDGGNGAVTAFYASTNTATGSSDLSATLRDNSFLNADFNVFLDEFANNAPLLDLDFDGAGGLQNRLGGHANYAVYLRACNDPVAMPSNYWGTQNTSTIANQVFDSADLGGLGTVDYSAPVAPSPDLRVAPLHRAAGYPVQIVVTGNPGDAFRLGAAREMGTWVTPYGTLDIPQSGTRVIVDSAIPASGTWVGSLNAAVGAPDTWYVQGAVFGGIQSITNLETVELRELP